MFIDTNTLFRRPIHGRQKSHWAPKGANDFSGETYKHYAAMRLRKTSRQEK
jgi:hypothetical protein